MAKTFKCSRCKRKFSMAAHLGRHMKAIHGAKGGRKSAAPKAKKVKRRVGRPKGARTAVGLRAVRKGVPAISAFGGETVRLFRDLQAYHGKLTAQRTALDAQLEVVAGAMDAFSPAKPAKRVRRKLAKRGRPARKGRPAKPAGRPGSLKDYIGRVLRQTTRPMSPREMGVGAVKAGFKTKSKDVTKAVSNTLPKMRGIKKVGFGKYQLAGR